ncbi:hypothetical protein EHS39_37325 [Ensifer sp. MPMI2T]|nr:hypothetical protein EHS39_37325 [Ensifer sp. MPMI2T]
MSYVKRKPLLVIVEKGLKSEGLIEPGYDWYVQTVSLDENALATKEFNRVLASWKAKLVEDDGPTSVPSHYAISPATMTIAQLAGSLQPSQLWSLLTGLAALIAGAFALGGKLLA